eukprot:TRINITY_DN4933_c0_g1_i3.p1 TRINITY_DN4933_c0_g1~~TRINITY_DN4933_c0_g1_i3.p1  ORF type:complete len:291 (+),score=56.94 TRINITY_DN4933_c0_g1_i3:541-1413(+)
MQDKKDCNVFLANFSFTSGLEEVTGRKFGMVCIEVTADSARPGKLYTIKEEFYFPELFLAKWFREKEGIEVPIYTFRSCGVQQMRESYCALVDELKIDAIILVDGGTDSVMFGDESGLGTPTEDMTSINSIHTLPRPLKLKILSCIGFGVDCFHGVCHSHFLENVAALTKKGGFLGVCSLTPEMVEAEKFKLAYLYSQPENSIVCSSVLSAIYGEFGNFHSPHTMSRTKGSQLYISPLMSMYWSFKLDTVAQSVLYLSEINNTVSTKETGAIIHTTAKKYQKRTAKIIPY